MIATVEWEPFQIKNSIPQDIQSFKKKIQSWIALLKSKIQSRRLIKEGSELNL
jgi:hypothetical protein